MIEPKRVKVFVTVDYEMYGEFPEDMTEDQISDKVEEMVQDKFGWQNVDWNWEYDC